MKILSLNSAINGMHQAIHKYRTHAANIAKLSFSEPAGPEKVYERIQEQPSPSIEKAETEFSALQTFRPEEIEEIDLATELTGTIVASHNFKANLKVLEQTDAMTEQLLDIIG